jgi:hypothetical protein
MTISIKKLEKTITDLAQFFFEPGEIEHLTDPKTGEVVGQETTNDLAYVQEKILGGMCYTAHTTLHFSKRSYDQAVAKVRAAMRDHRGDELSDEKLVKATGWAERLELQVATLQAHADACEAVYTAKFGKTYAMRPITEKASKPIMTDAMKAAMERFGGTENIRGGGVDAAEAEAA